MGEKLQRVQAAEKNRYIKKKENKLTVFRPRMDCSTRLT